MCSIEQVFSYDHRTLDQHERSVAELTTGEFQDDYDALIGQVVTQAPTRQLVVTSTAAASAAQWLHDDEWLLSDVTVLEAGRTGGVWSR